jgi:hypothetical protein
MSRLCISLLVVLIVLAEEPSKGTEGFYLSAHSLARQKEVHEALDRIKSNFTVERTTYTKSGVVYTIENATIDTTFLDSQQKV